MNPTCSSRRRRPFVTIGIVLLLGVTTRASADPVYGVSLTALLNGFGGTLTDHGTYVVGQNIRIADFFAVFPVNSGHYFITGDCGGQGCLDFDTRTGLTISGSVSALAIGPSILFSMAANFTVLRGFTCPPPYIRCLQVSDRDSNVGLMAPLLLEAFGVGALQPLTMFFQQDAVNRDGSPAHYTPNGMNLFATNVPEPSSVVLLGIGIVAGVMKKCRTRGRDGVCQSR